LEALIKDWGYIILFFYSFGGGFVALATACVLSASGQIDFTTSLVVAGVANFIGDQVLFLLARYNKTYANNLLGKYQRYVAKTENFMLRFGSFAIILQKYIYGIKTLIPLLIGLTHFSSKKFVIYNLLGTILWTLIIGWVFYYLGSSITNFSNDFKYFSIGIILILIFGSAYYLKKI